MKNDSEKYSKTESRCSLTFHQFNLLFFFSVWNYSLSLFFRFLNMYLNIHIDIKQGESIWISICSYFIHFYLEFAKIQLNKFTRIVWNSQKLENVYLPPYWINWNLLLKKLELPCLRSHYLYVFVHCYVRTHKITWRYFDSAQRILGTYKAISKSIIKKLKYKQ